MRPDHFILNQSKHSKSKLKNLQSLTNRTYENSLILPGLGQESERKTNRNYQSVKTKT